MPQHIDLSRLHDLASKVEASVGHTTPRISAQEIRNLEREVGFTLPEDIVSVMRYAGHLPMVHDPSRVVLDYKYCSDWMERQWVPVASDGCGNSFVAILVAGEFPIVFTEGTGANGPEYVMASNAISGVIAILEEELELRDPDWLWHCNTALSIDPHIADYEGVFPLPWEVADE